MLKQFVADRHSNVVTIRQFRNELQCFEMDMDEIHATTIKLNHFTDSHLFILKTFLTTLFQHTLGYLVYYYSRAMIHMHTLG